MALGKEAFEKTLKNMKKAIEVERYDADLGRYGHTTPMSNYKTAFPSEIQMWDSACHNHDHQDVAEEDLETLEQCSMFDGYYKLIFLLRFQKRDFYVDICHSYALGQTEKFARGRTIRIGERDLRLVIGRLLLSQDRAMCSEMPVFKHRSQRLKGKALQFELEERSNSNDFVIREYSLKPEPGFYRHVNSEIRFDFSRMHYVIRSLKFLNNILSDIKSGVFSFNWWALEFFFSFWHGLWIYFFILFQIPSGYERKTDGDSVYFVNIFTGVRWYSAKDDAGKTYFYEENGNESCWSLPNVSQTIQDSASRCSEDEIESPTEEEKVEVREKEIQIRPKPKTDSQFKRYTLPVSSPNIQIGNISIVVVKQGPLNKTKLVENGKKHRKSWSSCHLVLTDTFLLFFKDSKTFAALQSGSGNSNVKPDHNVDLKGAEIKWSSPEKSRRNNVFEVATLLGMTMLLQDDNLQNAGEWFKEISDVIGKINQKTLPPTPSLAHMRPMSQDSPRGSLVKGDTSTLPPSKKDAKNKVNRTKSLKMKFLGSSEELEEEPEGLPSTPTTPGVAGVQSKANIRDRLLKFFLRRPAMEDLFKKGIMKNEPVFGSTLKDLQATDLSDVPLFVTKCIGEIEKGERLKADGVYRQSGNLCTIQRIRLQVDQGNLGILETMDDDVHVLTGALKLFFRELKEPLIPWEFVNKLLLAANHQSKKKKVEQMKNLISKMPSAHKATLAYLLRHLVKVTHFKDKNRMQFSNLAIVFGPTLMWPPPQLVSYNLALDMMQQNIIVEALLTNVEHIFWLLWFYPLVFFYFCLCFKKNLRSFCLLRSRRNAPLF